MSERLLREDQDGVCTLTLNWPEALNALDTETIQAINTQCEALEGQAETIGCMVLRGAGRAFCAGADLKAMTTVVIDPRYKPRRDRTHHPAAATGDRGGSWRLLHRRTGTGARLRFHSGGPKRALC